MKQLLTLLLATLLFLMTMIDTSPPERWGTCIVGEYTYSPVSNLDCEGVFK
jgi:hypothetical protein